MIISSHLGKRIPRRGIIVPYVAICLVALLAITAITIDAGLLLADRQKAHAIADAAALAAAIDLFDNWSSNSGVDVSGTAATSAKDTILDQLPTGTSLIVKNDLPPPYTSLNGYTAVINIPPQSGPYAGQPSYAEVVLIMPQQRFFSNVFGSGNLNVSARAVALGSQAPLGIGILVLDPVGSNTMQLSATGSVDVSGGSVVVDSSDSAALHLSAAGGVTAAQVRLSGSGYSTTSSGSVNGMFSPTTNSTILVGQPAIPDPLKAFAAANTPTTSGCPTYSNVHLNSFSYSASNPSANNLIDGNGVQYGTVTSANSVTLYPGFYSGGLTINQNTPGVTFTLATGVYIFNQNVTFNGYGTIQSGLGGTLLYLSSGSLTNSSQNVDLNLSPMTTGSYSNPAIVIWSDVNNSSGVNFSNGGALNVTSGIIYVPNTSSKTQFTAEAGATAQLGTQVIVGNLWLTGSGSFNVNVGSSSAPGRQLYLVE